MNAEPAGEFRDNRLFAGLTEETIDAAVVALDVVDCPQGTLIFEEGEPGEDIYLIADGSVCISKRGRGGQQETLDHLAERDFFGEMAAFDPAPRSARATAVRQTKLGRLGRERLDGLLRQAPLPLLENLSKRGIARLRNTDERFIREILEAERLSLLGTMASSIIHDLKGPIGAIHGATQMLRRNPDEARVTKWTGMIERQVDRMLRMVGDLLDFSKGVTSLERRLMPMEEVVGELQDQILWPAQEKGVVTELDVRYHGQVRLDLARFMRVLANIVKNAVEAMPAGGRIEVEVQRQDGQVSFSIADTGIGIPRELLPKIFEPFVSYGKASGTGLGMAIAKSIVEAHGGQISVDSTEGVGTRFTITIPAE